MTTVDKLRVQEILAKSSKSLLSALSNPNLAPNPKAQERMVAAILLDTVIIGVEITLKHIGTYGKNTHTYAITHATLEDLMEMRRELGK